MRLLLRLGLLAFVAAPIAAAASGSSMGNAVPSGCISASATPAIQLPTTLRARTGRGLFTIARDGTICRVSTDPLPAPGGVGWWPDGIWAKSEHGHVLIGRWRRTLWRSTGRVAHSSSVDTIVVGRNEIAFSTFWRRSRLYLAPLGGREHFVAGGQFPLGWTSGGLYVGRRDGAVLFRSGNRVRRIAQAKVRLAAYDPSSQSLDFVSGGRLFRARGIRTELVASLSRFGLPSERNLQLQLLGHLIALQNQRRLVVLRPDGSLFASTLLPRSHHALVSASPTPAPGGAEVAFAVMRPDRPIETQVMERGVETVYLLRPGARAADPVYKKRMWFNVCGHGASLSWRRAWLLYSTGEGPAAAIATRSGRTIELTALIRRLPGFKGDDSGPFSVTWR